MNFAYNFIGNRPRAEELAQDVFLQVFRAGARYEANAKFTTWLYRIATNACLNEVRRPERRYRTRPLEREPDESGAHGEIYLPDPTALSGESALAGRELEARIREVLGTLPENQRAALVLSRVDGLSYREVADALECSESATRIVSTAASDVDRPYSRVHRGLSVRYVGLGSLMRSLGGVTGR